MKNAGLVSMGGYLPAKNISQSKVKTLINYLRENTLLPEEYVRMIEDTGCMPGSVENNYDGWESKPWFQAWVNNLPGKKKEDPFQGTKERRRVPMDPTSIRESVYPHPMLPSDAETLAGAMAIVNAGIQKDEIDLVMIHSQVRDWSLPANVSLVQHKLKLPYAGAYAVDTCCSSFVTMLELASALVRSGVKKKVLIISSILDSAINDKSDYYSVNTGDAAVAGLVTEVEDGFGYLGSESFSDGSRHDGIVFTRRPPHLIKITGSSPTYEQEFVTFHNQEAVKAIGANAQKDITRVVTNLLKKTGYTTQDIALFVTHQPVAWAANAWREAIGIAPERFYESFEKYGNIATASSAVNLLEGIESGMIQAGEIALVASTGAGENFIGLLERVTPQLIQSVKP